MRRFLYVSLILTSTVVSANERHWGFYGHKLINRLAIFTLPEEMSPFYKKFITYIESNAIKADLRKFVVKGEGHLHYINLDSYSHPDSIPLFWKDAVAKYGVDTLEKKGTVPWHVTLVKYKLTEAFRYKNVRQILKLSADLGHYIADANVPLHTSKNYNGQLSNQRGIHAFWESRLPELFSKDYDFFVGRANYIIHPQATIWRAVRQAYMAKDSVLVFEKEYTNIFRPSEKYSIIERNGVMQKDYSEKFSLAYHKALNQQVERQMRKSIKMLGDFLFTAWVDAGQPDLNLLLNYTPTKEEILEDEEEDKNIKLHLPPNFELLGH